MYHPTFQYPYTPVIQPLYYYRYDNPVQSFPQVDQQQLTNFQVPLMIQQNNEQHRILSDIYTYTPQPNMNSDGINALSEQNQAYQLGIKHQSPSLTCETRRLTNQSFEQFQSCSTYDKNNKKQHTEYCDQLSIIDLSQIHPNKISTTNATLHNPSQQETFSEDYRVARYRNLKPGQKNTLKIIFNHSKQFQKTSENLLIKNEEMEVEENMQQFQNNSQKVSLMKKESQSISLDLQSTSSRLTKISENKKVRETLKQHRNWNETMQLENNVNYNTFLSGANQPKSEFKNIKNPKLNQSQNEKNNQVVQQLFDNEDNHNFSINKDSSFTHSQNCSITKQQKENLPSNNNRNIPLNFEQSVPDQKSTKVPNKKLPNQSLLGSSRESACENTQKKGGDKYTSVIDQIKSNLAQYQSIQTALDDVQFNRKDISQIEKLSKCIYILQQSESHKIFQQILKQPFFLTSDLHTYGNLNQTLKSVSQIPKIKDESSNKSSSSYQLQQKKLFKRDQSSSLQDNLNLQINSSSISIPSTPNQHSQLDSQRRVDIDSIEKCNQPNHNIEQKSSTNNTSQKVSNSDQYAKIPDFQDSIKRRMLFQPRDQKMLNLYNFSVMRDFPERRNSNNINNNNQSQNSDLDMQNDNQNLSNRMDEEDEADSDSRKQKSKSSISKQKKKTLYSRFHNLNKLFIYNIMAMLQSENLENFNIPQFLRVELIQFLKRLKLSGKIRPSSDNPVETETFAVESFSHVHYNVLFLKINESNLLIVRKSPRDIFLHKLCFNVDLNNCLDIEIMKINIIKKIIFQIFIQSIQEHLYVDDHSFSKSNNRVLYTIKAIRGIKKLSLGIYFNRF